MCVCVCVFIYSFQNIMNTAKQEHQTFGRVFSDF